MGLSGFEWPLVSSIFATYLFWSGAAQSDMVGRPRALSRFLSRTTLQEEEGRNGSAGAGGGSGGCTGCDASDAGSIKCDGGGWFGICWGIGGMDGEGPGSGGCDCKDCLSMLPGGTGG